VAVFAMGVGMTDPDDCNTGKAFSMKRFSWAVMTGQEIFPHEPVSKKVRIASERRKWK
jgi:hypothetical protein